jgi:hypothetical protein
MVIELNYVKKHNEKLFKDFETNLKVTNCQNFIPLYKKFFKLNETNYNHINLNHNLFLHKLKGKSDESENTYKCELKDVSNNSTTKYVYFKYSPLLDPSRYMTGKYNIENTNLLNLPDLTGDNCHTKTNEENNSAFVDGFFSYLTSKLLHEHKFTHGLDFYGAFLAVKTEFLYNVIDEIDYLMDSAFFNKYKNNLFSIDEELQNKLFECDTRTNKKRIVINNENTNESNDFITLDDITDLNEIESLTSTQTNVESIEVTEFTDVITSETSKLNKSKSTQSFCSSRSSNTNYDGENENSEEGEDNKSGDDDVSLEIEEVNADENSKDWEDVSDSNETEESEEIEVVNATIKNFPVNIICLEKCVNTLDSLINDGMNTSELTSALMQTIMTLITYQSLFKFTHNDLHTNNIMYNSTDEKYLFYKYNGKYYKVPTYGKIYKIIDFGRAIYKFNEKLLCSDSFHKEGDAATQYNFEPYMDDKKPRLEPNYSFDLCRLACSMFDFFEESDEELEPIKVLIEDWCKDDKGRNVLYKNNGEERYPEFKLYKMIARTVHNHVPSNQLEREIFSQYVISKSKIGKTNHIIDIDSLPKYY